MFEFVLENKKNLFWSLPNEEIQDIEKVLNIQLPEQLKKFYQEIGYGFFKSNTENTNRLMDPLSVRDFRIRQGDYSGFVDDEMYQDIEETGLVFFEADSDLYLLIGISKEMLGKIYYGDFKIANSLKEFLEKIMEDDNYYIDLPN
ncbi:SMI1/KNR4 family protein [Listeria goaensis]|uniref:SMI1/KNR4 family protein n=1 Tax=Listeria goaensis TaxID=1649188 RepID=UPI0013C35902|nr:SMI1/KNR4 family protein [Listeria goaensis]